MINPAEKELLMSDCDFVFDSSLPVFKKSYSLILLDRYFIFFFFKETFKCLFVDYVLFGLQANWLGNCKLVWKVFFLLLKIKKVAVGFSMSDLMESIVLLY